MLKIFLVEDEKVVREGIKNSIDWEKEGFLFAGEASDGELAFPMIQELAPDIVITDIKMTFMNGLELSRLIKKEMPYIKIIILSGYDEFEYAKEAIGIGVTDYLLKPITREELIQAIRRVANMIEASKNQTLYGESLAEPPIEGGDVSLQEINWNTLDKNMVKDFLKTGTINELKGFIGEYCSSMGENSLKSVMFRQYVVMDIYFSCVNFMKKINRGQKEYNPNIMEIKDLAHVISTMDDTKRFIEDILSRTIKIRDSLADDKYADLIHQAKKYIKENYNNENLSLARVANSVNVSQNHFSAVFSQETGGTFIEYVTNLRMEKAKELLRCTNQKSSEIAYAVGYKDPHYFSFLFKKTQNCTPKEYRSKGKVE